LYRIARSQRIEDPASCRVMCGSCGIELTSDGLLHWPDCADPEHVMFLKQDAMTGEWSEVGQRPPDAGPLAF
jgi:ferredoxin